MAIPTIESTTLTTNTTTVAMPATRPDGDLYVCIAMNGDNGAFTAPAAWTDICGIADRAAINAWYRIGDSEPASYTITGGNQPAFVIYRFSGFNTSNPIDISGTATGTSTTGTAPDITTTVDETMVIRFMSIRKNGVTSTPSTEDYKGDVGYTGYGCSHEDGPNPAGATGTGVFTHSSEGWSAGTIAIAAGDAPAGVVDNAMFFGGGF